MLQLNGEKIIPPLGQKVVTIIQLAKVLYASQIKVRGERSPIPKKI